ncbi:Gfo/Idh/MocA family oxidoreductase [Muricomes intestini]|jgi:myo-inositol 2-dehydrogenase/D-chiro-inositol 1-dehydrogenase|uniref:Gfo/Idh/MocA family oxidoreductase n=1 Tax=Muricomes intestini TaxID=1796634 RepID=UPI002FDE8E6B
MDKKIKFGIIGLGTMGRIHLENLQGRIKAAEVVAVCARNPEKVEKVRREYDISYGFTSIDELLAIPELDAVVIATGADAHKEPILKACAAGKHIFCEKPLAKTLEDCEEIEAAARKNAGKCFTVGFMRRFDPSYAEAKERIEAGEIGTPIMYKGSSIDPAEVLPDHLEGVKNGIYVPWFIEMGSHDTDLARWFLGGEPAKVHAYGGAYVCKELAAYDDYDNGASLTAFNNGAMAYIQVGRTGTCSHVESEIVGTKGTLRINNIPRRNYLSALVAKEYREACQDSFTSRWGEAFHNEMEDFVECIKGGRKPPVTAYDGRMSLAFCLKLHKAYMEGKENE